MIVETAVKVKKEDEIVGKHECKECGKVFRQERGLKLHAIKHGGKLICEVCQKEFTCKS